MGFATALSGLNAASNNLAVTGNNIANANTTGFKKSRAEFADVYASSIGGMSNATPGSGVKVTNDSQQFTQGTLNFTDNNLDLAISGEGFFTMAKSPTETTELTYTRAGEFKLDTEGYLVNNQGKALMVYKPNGTAVADGFSTGVLQPVQINTLTGLPSATTSVALAVNVNATNTIPDTQLANGAWNTNAVALKGAQDAYYAALTAANGDTTAGPVVTAQTALDTAKTTFAAADVFDPSDNSTYNSQTSSTIYDSLGTPHILTTYFVKGPSVTASGSTTTDWYAYHYMSEPATPTARTAINAGTYPSSVTAPTNTTDIPTPGILTFDSSGILKQPSNGKFSLSDYTILPATGAEDIKVSSMSFFGSTQVQEKFSVNSMNQDGLAAGRLTGIDIDDQGVIFARFSNGGSQATGKVALSRFPSNSGLNKLGDTAWGQSANSGQPINGEAGSNNFGLIQAGALEGSNVDLSKELVNLIVAQQAYQASAQTITTENSIMQTILNIR